MRIVPNNEQFLSSYPSIGKNQAEYQMFTCMYDECNEKVFLLEIRDQSKVMNCFSDIVRHINSKYRSYDVRLFTLSAEGYISEEIIKESAGASVKDEDLWNFALTRSQENSSIILIRAARSLVLIRNGEFDTEFRNMYYDRRKMIMEENRKLNIDDLERAFEFFHAERKFKGCDYIIDNNVSNNISEQQLRNHLIEYLSKETNMMIVPEFCTSRKEDEESVDISVIDKNKLVAIIEVKYFVKEGLFENKHKKAYSFARFSDGYRQLDRYCEHLNQDYCLHSAFLYMFYAHDQSEEKIKNIAKDRLEEYLKGSTCSKFFKCHYKGTFCDNMLDHRTGILRN